MELIISFTMGTIFLSYQSFHPLINLLGILIFVCVILWVALEKRVIYFEEQWKKETNCLFQ